jgi:hypothetical protein
MTGSCAHADQNVRWLRAAFGGGLIDIPPLDSILSLGRFVLIWLRIQGWRSKVKSFSSRSVGREDDWRLLESWDAEAGCIHNMVRVYVSTAKVYFVMVTVGCTPGLLMRPKKN